MRVDPGTTARETKRGRPQAWLDILLVVVLFAASGMAVALLAGLFAGRLPLAVLLILQGVVVLAGLTLLLARAGQRWGDVGLSAFRGRDAARALLLFILCMAANLLLMLFLQLAVPQDILGHLERLQAIASALADGLPVAGIAASMFFVGIYEELAARGFLLARCRAALDGVWLPVLLSAILFGLGHAYQGWIGVAQTTLLGVVLGYYTVRWASLWPAILAHALVNTLSVVVLAGLDAPLAG